MAHDTHAHGGDADAMVHHDVEHHHPTWGTYVKVGVILTIITAVEVAAYYIPAWSEAKFFAASMLLLSATKFIIVVMFYMHLKYDHRLFRALFAGPLTIAIITIAALLFLFGQLAIRLRG
jgi:cytochrome c oxidase subunit 4